MKTGFYPKQDVCSIYLHLHWNGDDVLYHFLSALQ